MRERVGQLASLYFPLAIAVVVPLAGLLLAIQYGAVNKDRDMALRVGLATFLGVCLWAVVLSL